MTTVRGSFIYLFIYLLNIIVTSSGLYRRMVGWFLAM